MKYLKSMVLVLLVTNIVGCGTVGGAVSGAGTDLQKAGDWIKTR
jgi:predicted small secreted protein